MAKNTFKALTLSFQVTATEFVVNAKNGNVVDGLEVDCTQNTAHIVSSISSAAELKQLKKDLLTALQKLENLA